MTKPPREGRARDLGMATPPDLWAVGVTLDDLRDGDGALDLDAAREKVGTVLSERPTWRRPAPDLGAGARPPAQPERKPGLADLLGKRA